MTLPSVVFWSKHKNDNENCFLSAVQDQHKEICPELYTSLHCNSVHRTLAYMSNTGCIDSNKLSFYC